VPSVWVKRGDQAPVAAERCVPVAAGREFSADFVTKALEVPPMWLRMEVTTGPLPNKKGMQLAECGHGSASIPPRIYQTTPRLSRLIKDQTYVRQVLPRVCEWLLSSHEPSIASEPSAE
jgi:hypothetical protein